MAKLFITNATGYIGTQVAETFKAKGYEVAALARNAQAEQKLQAKGIQPVKGDLRQPQTFVDAAKNADVIIHTAATNDADYGVVDQAAVDALLDALEGTNKTFIYTSGTWVLGNTGEQPAHEETATNPIPLVEFRAKVEKQIRAAKERGVKTVVIRPTIVYGRGGGLFGSSLATAKTDGYARYIGDGENRVSTVHVDDLGRLYLLAAEKAPAGSLFHGTNGQAVKLREIAEVVALAAGVPGKVQSWPLEEARKVVGPFVDGFVLDQHVVAPATQKALGWEAKEAQVGEDIKQQNRETAGQKQ